MYGKMKKILAVLLCFAMVMQSSVAIFAAEESGSEVALEAVSEEDAAVSEEATGNEEAEEAVVEEAASEDVEVVEDATGLEEVSEALEEETVEEADEEEITEESVGDDEDVDEYTHILNAADFTAGEKSGTVKVANDYFTLTYGSGAKVEAGEEVSFDDDNTLSQYIQFAAAGSKDSNVITVTTKEPNTSFKVYYVPTEDKAEVNILDKDGKVVDQTYDKVSAGSAQVAIAAGMGEGTFSVVLTKGAKLYKLVATEIPAPAVYTLNADTMTIQSFTAATPIYVDKAGKEVKDAASAYFTVIGHDGTGSKSDVEVAQDPPTFSDGYIPTNRIKLNGGTSTGMKGKCIKLTTTKADATVKVWWTNNGSGRTLDFYDATGSVIDQSIAGSGTTGYINIFTASEPGTYYVGMSGSLYVNKIQVTDGADIVARRGDWAEVADPEITSATDKYNSDTGIRTVTVKAKGCISPLDGGDILEIRMKGTNTTLDTSMTSTDVKDTDHTVYFEPSDKLTINSDTYTFTATLKRNSDFYGTYADKVGTVTKSLWYDMPLETPKAVGTGVFNQGDGTAKVAWYEVDEADYYKVEVKVGSTTKTVVDKTTKIFALYNLAEYGIADGKTYNVIVTPYRINQNPAKASLPESERTDEGSALTIKNAKANYTTKDAEWVWVRMGTSTDSSNNGSKDAVIENNELKSVRVYSLNGKGKIVPATINNDGISFYYTPVPKGNNFKITATANVNDWYMSNGQDGFGLVAVDCIVPNKEYILNNSIMAAATKTQYRWDGASVTTDTTIPNTDMKIGLSALGRYGITPENRDFFESNIDEAIEQYAVIDQTSLEYSCANVNGGTYNLIGNATATTHAYDSSKKGIKSDSNPDGYTAAAASDLGTVANPLTKVKFTIEKNNTGYYVSYTDYKGKTTTKKYYYNSKYTRDMLDQMDEDYEYVGLFCARNADVDFTDIEFTTEKADDSPAEAHDPTLYSTTAQFTSASNANSENYELMFYTNWNGTVNIVDDNGDVVYDGDVTADEYKTISTNLALGANTYTATYIPDQNWHLKDDEDNQLSSYDAVRTSITVNYRTYGSEGSFIYVSPKGTSSGAGTQESPLDVYTACKYAQPGQTIIIMKGDYKLTSSVVIGRGVDGTADKPIYMIADPSLNLDADDPNNERPVFDFSAYKTGIQLAGNYWYLSGFDVTNAGDGYKGMSINGSYNVVDNICAYRNGNTGIELARMKATDKKDRWPHDNLVKNCTSFDNSDYGYEDADGFAAKLTVGDGNVFDGCMAYLNADDGWDLYAKSESGMIGAVVIKNSVAYLNGWVHAWAKGDYETIVSAGNGNGFKMGGENLFGNHQIYNSYSFYNKANGIESNSCPDIKVNNCVAFNNMGNNIGLYTSTAAYTDYAVKNFVSFRNLDTITYGGEEATSMLSKAEKFKLVSQNQADEEITNETTFYWNSNKKKSMNSANATFSGTNFESTVFDYTDFNPVETWDSFIKRNDNGTLNMNGFLAVKSGVTFPGSDELGMGGEATIATSVSDNKIVIGDNEYDETTGSINAGEDDSDKSATVALPDNASGLVAMTDDVLVSQIKDDYYYYTGKAIIPEISIYEAGTYSLLNYKNWAITYKNNRDAGTATVNIKGKGSYSGNLSMNFVINPISLDPGFTLNRYNKTAQLYQDEQVIFAPDYLSVATGNAKVPVPDIYYDTYKLKAGKDFEYVYAKDGKEVTGGVLDVGTYTVSVNGIGNFAGHRDITLYVFDSSAVKDINTCTIPRIRTQQLNVSSGSRPFDLSANAIMDGDKALVAGEDYFVSYFNNYAMGKASAVITGNIEKGYCGTAKVDFGISRARIDKKNISIFGTIEGQSLSGDTIPEVHYSGKNIMLQDCEGFKVVYTTEDGEKVTLKNNVDYKVVPSNGYHIAKTVKYTIVGKGSYVGKSFGNLTILPIDITDVNNYNGVNKDTQISISWNSAGVKVNKDGATTGVTVKLNGRTLRYMRDYRVQYTANRTPGTAIFRIAGKNVLKGGIASIPGGRDFTYTILPNDFNNNTVKAYADDVILGTAGNDVPLVAKVTLYEKETGKKLSGSDYDPASIKIYDADGNDVTGSKVNKNNAGDDYTVTISANSASRFYNTGYVTATLHVGYNLSIAGTNPERSTIGWQPKYDGKDLVKTYKKIIKESGAKDSAGYVAYLESLSGNALAAEIAKYDLDTDNLNLVYGYQTYDGTLKAANLEFVRTDVSGNEILDEGGYPEVGYTFVYNAPSVSLNNVGLEFGTDYTVARNGWDKSSYSGVIRYRNNTKAGTATVFLQGTGIYAGVKQVTYTISRYDYNLMEIVKAVAAYKNAQ